MTNESDNVLTMCKFCGLGYPLHWKGPEEGWEGAYCPNCDASGVELMPDTEEKKSDSET